MVVLLGAAIYFVPQYLYPRGFEPSPPLPEPRPAIAAEASPTVVPAGDIVRQANAALADGQWGKAAALFEQASQRNPALASAQAGWARALLFDNQPGAALPHARTAVTLSPGSAPYQAVLAQALDWTGDSAGATSTALHAVQLDPAFPLGYAYLAEAQTDAYQLPQASASLEKAVAAGGGSDPEVLRVQGYLSETQGDYNGAVAKYQQAVKAAPKASYLYIALGQALRAAHQLDAADNAFRQAAQLNPRDPRGEGGQGMVAYEREDYVSAQSHLEASVRVDPNYANGYGQLGWVFYVQKKYQLAQPNFEHAAKLEKDPVHNAAYRNALGWIYVNQHQYAQASDEFTTALKEDPHLQGAQQGLQAVQQAQAHPTP